MMVGNTSARPVPIPSILHLLPRPGQSAAAYGTETHTPYDTANSWRKTMTRTKTLMLAALVSIAALSLGACTGPMATNIPAGSSDTDTMERGAAHTAEYIFNHGLDC